MERKNAWKSCDEAKLAQVNALCADYQIHLRLQDRA